jgi:hypothetical protein
MRVMENSNRPHFAVTLVLGQGYERITATEILTWLEKATPCEECGSKLPRDHSREEATACIAKMQEKKPRQKSLHP